MKTTLAWPFFLTFVIMGCLASPTATPAPLRPSPPSSLVATPSLQLSIPTVTPVSTGTSTIVDTITAPTPTVPSRPHLLTRLNVFPLPGAGRAPVSLGQLGDTLYVANRSTNNLAVIREGRVTSFVSTPQSPVALAADKSSGRLYVATELSRTVSLVQVGSLERTAQFSETVASLAFAGGKLFVGSGGSPTVSILDASTLNLRAAIRLSHGFEINQLLVDAPRHRLYAVPYGEVIVMDLDTLRELFSVQVPYIYGSLALNPVDGTIWAGSYDEKARASYLVGFDLDGKELRRVRLGDDLRQAVRDVRGNLFISDSFQNRVYAVQISSGRVLAEIAVDLGPIALSLNEPNHRLFVANEQSDNISIIDTAQLKVVGVIPLAMHLNALLANPDRSRIYAASGSTDSVYVIESDRVVGEVKVGRNPVDLARDSQSGRLFVANSSDGTLSVVDERSLSVQSTLPITRNLTTVAVDESSRKLFAGSIMLDLDSMTPQKTYFAHGAGYPSLSTAEFVRVRPAGSRIYVFAYNGIPGSNSRTILYTLDETDLGSSQVLGYRNSGNVTALAFDPMSQFVYAGVTHPLSYESALDVWNASDTNLAELAMPARTTGLVVNPRTNHLFLSHSHSDTPSAEPDKVAVSAVQVLDTRTLGQVDWLNVPGSPGDLALLGDIIYVAGLDDGQVTLIQDGQTAQPAAPTPTFTLSPYPSLTTSLATPSAAVQSPVAAGPTLSPEKPRLTPTPCAATPVEPFLGKWTGQVAANLGCQVTSVITASFAYQPYRGGYMYDDIRNESTKTVYTLYDDHTYEVYADTWSGTEPEIECPEILVPEGLIRPRRGFGKVWCKQESVRVRLPGGTEPESAISLQYVAFERGYIWNSPTGLIALFANGTWQ